MNPLKIKLMEAGNHILSRSGRCPEIAVLTGTGLGGCVDLAAVTAQFDYRDIPHFPVSTVEGHPGQLIIGHIGSRPVAVFHSPQDIAFPVRVMKELGIKTVIISNAAGGLDPQFIPGDIMIITDHINLTGHNPLIGKYDPEWGDRFPHMIHAYSPDFIDRVLSIGKTCSIRLRTGVYAGLVGPSLETPAESRFLQTIGASAVGFSTVMEVITAVQAGMRVLGFSTITNINNPQDPVPATIG